MSAGSLPDEAQLLQKLKQQNALLKKAVLQEQRRRTAADEALEKSKGEGLTLTAHIEELSALLTSLSTSQLHVDTAPPVQQSRKDLEGSGWRKNLSLGWMGKGDSAVQSDGGEGKAATLREELHAKAEENERLHMRLFATSQELEHVKEDLQATRAEVKLNSNKTLPCGSEVQSQHQRQHQVMDAAQQQFWAQAESAIAAAERSAFDAQQALDAARVSSVLSVVPALRGNALPVLTSPSWLTPREGGRIPDLPTTREVPWWTKGDQGGHVGKMLEVAVPMLRELMTTYTVHHAALGERMQRLQMLGGTLAPSPGHTRTARQLVVVVERHHRCIMALHSSTAALRTALCPHRTASAPRIASQGGSEPIVNTIELISGAGGKGSASAGAEGANGKGAGVGVLVWRMKTALRDLAQVYDTLRVCWEDELREETVWVERVAEAETFGPVCVVFACVVHECLRVCAHACKRGRWKMEKREGRRERERFVCL